MILFRSPFLLAALFSTSVHAYQRASHSLVSKRMLRLNVATETPSLKFDQKSWIKGYITCPNEVCEELISSSIPLDIEGTYFRNGGAKYEVGKELVMHPFDADGMISAVTFKDGRAMFRNRFVQTKEFKAEQKFKRVLYRGAFGTMKKGFLANFLDLNVKNTVHFLSPAFFFTPLITMSIISRRIRTSFTGIRSFSLFKRVEFLITWSQIPSIHWASIPFEDY